MGVDVSLEGDVDVNVNMDDTFLLDMWWLGLTLAMGFVLKRASLSIFMEIM